MRALAINKQKIYYALYSGKTPVVDVNGNKTGEYTIAYGSPTEVRVNVSAARGTSDVEQFGINTNYSKTIVTDDVNCPIDEKTILWIGIEPTREVIVNDVPTSVATPHNYVVSSVARSINSVTYAIREVMVS